MVCAKVASDSPMVVSDPLGGFYYLWWDPYANELVLAPECIQMRKIIGETYTAFALGEKITKVVRKWVATNDERTGRHYVISDGQSLSERADRQRLVNAISGCIEGVTQP